MNPYENSPLPLIGQLEQEQPVSLYDALMGGAGLGGAAFFAQTGRMPTDTATIAQQAQAARDFPLTQGRTVNLNRGGNSLIGRNLPSGGVNPTVSGSAPRAVNTINFGQLASRMGEGLRNIPGMVRGATQGTLSAASNLIGTAPTVLSNIALRPGAGTMAEPLLIGAADLANRAGITGQSEAQAAELGSMYDQSAAEQQAYRNLPNEFVTQDGVTSYKGAPFFRDVSPEEAARIDAGIAAQMEGAFTDSTPFIRIRQDGEMVDIDQALAELQSRLSSDETVAPTAPATPTLAGLTGVTEQSPDIQSKVEATRAALLREFGAPTISQIQEADDIRAGRMTQQQSREAFAEASAAREARLAEAARRPDESAAERDTRLARAKQLGTDGMSFSEAKRQAESILVQKGHRNPTADQINAVARGIQAEEPIRIQEQQAKAAAAQLESEVAQARLNKLNQELIKSQEEDPDKTQEAEQQVDRLITGGIIPEDKRSEAILDMLGYNVEELLGSGLSLTAPVNAEATDSLGLGL